MKVPRHFQKSFASPVKTSLRNELLGKKGKEEKEYEPKNKGINFST